MHPLLPLLLGFAAAALAASPAPAKERVAAVEDTGWEVSEPAGFTRDGQALHWLRHWRRTYRKDHRRAVGEGDDQVNVSVLPVAWGPKGEWPAAGYCGQDSAALLKPVVEGSHYGARTFSYVCEDPTPDDNDSHPRQQHYDVLFQGRRGARFISLTLFQDLPRWVVRSDADVEIPAVREAMVKDGPNMKAFRLMTGTLHPTRAAASPDGPAAAPPAPAPGDGAVPLLR